MRASFVHQRLAALGAQPGTALTVPGENVAAAVVLTDLSPFARTGFKGADTPDWLARQGLALPDVPNRAVVQADGSVLARLSAGEFLLLGRPGHEKGPGDERGLVERLDAAWSWEEGAGLCFPLPRQDSHAWFHLRGPAVPQMLAKLCGVDLRRHVFADGSVAQTSVARLNAILVRQGDDFHLLADSASAEYLWECVVDSMAEFGGSVAGASHLLA